ncbi:hypothetical protein Tco_0455099 [Tanacetum coccineum]
MKVLNLMVIRQVKAEKRFKYHWGCKELKITSLCFADDLLMLCHGDLISASVLRRGLDEFCVSSGLRPSMSKSEAFFGNVPDEVIADINLVMPFKIGVLPIKYLGVPMMSKRLTSKDCKPLIEMIRKRIGDWRNKVLSFAGRLQLISSVLSSMQVYWASLFILPIEICNLIDRLFKNFLWTRGESIRGMASVAWKDVCKPKSQGGLGLRSVHLWNEALMAKHIWNIVSRKNSIWVKWVNIYCLKGRCMWDDELSRGYSWSWKQLFDLKNKIKKFVQVKIGNGNDCNIWFDKWHSTGPISRLINHEVLKHANLCLMTKVSNMIDGNEWSWPIDWDGRFDVVTKIPERNGRCFMKKFKDIDCLFNMIVDSVRLRLLGLTIKTTPSVLEASKVWNLQINKADFHKRMDEALDRNVYLFMHQLMLAGLEVVYGDGSMGVWLVPGFLDDSEYSLFLQLAI